jgi:hypothetical protein
MTLSGQKRELGVEAGATTWLAVYVVEEGARTAESSAWSECRVISRHGQILVGLWRI